MIWDFSHKLLFIIIFIACVAVYGYTGGFSGVSTNPNSEYHVSDSTFKMGSNWWTFVNSSSTNDSVEFTNYYSVNWGVPYEITLRLTQYADSSKFESKYQNLSSSSDNYSVKTENKSIDRIHVSFINTTNAKSNYTFQDYFFQKNGKYYSIHLDLKNYEKFYDTAIEFALKSIISTIN
jgi:hypothetical protein